MTIEIVQQEDLTMRFQEQVRALYTQLNPAISQVGLPQILARDSSTLLVACREGDLLLGLALLARYTVISGHKGMIEDVVVDSSYRGLGIGRNLMNKLIGEARRTGVDEVLLFTGHHRIAAINLYKSLGFQLKNSGLYSLKLN